MIEPLCVIMQLAIPVFVVFDGDDSPEQAKSRSTHERDNLALLRILGSKDAAAFPKEPLWEESFVQWPNRLSVSVQAEIGTGLWAECCESASAEWGHAGNLRKNPLHIGSALRLAWDRGARSTTLARVCDRILA